MHKYKVGSRMKVLVDGPCLADLCKGEIVEITFLQHENSYRVLGKRSSIHWSVQEDQIKPIGPTLEENE